MVRCAPFVFVVACILVFAKIILEIMIMQQSPLPSQREQSAPLSSQQSALLASQKIALLSSQEGLDGRCPWAETKFVFGRCDLQLIFKRLITRVPFSYAHYNDGEFLAMKEVDGHTDRGMQRMSPELKGVIARAFHREAPGLVFGIPCAQEFSHDNEFANEELRNSTVERTIATVFINSNYRDARSVLLRYIQRNPDRGVHMVVADSANMTRFESGTGMRPAFVTTVSGRDAFPKGYHDNINNTRHHMPGDIVIICAGPLGRILATEWFLRRPETTYLELGSFFDVDLFGGSLGADYYDRGGSVPHCGDTTEIQTELLLDLIDNKTVFRRRR